MIRASLIFWALLIALASGALYHTSYRVQALQQQLDSLNHDILAEQEALHVYKAEWAYLTAPGRLEKLVKRYTKLEATQTQQIVRYNKLDDVLPLRGEKVASKASEPKKSAKAKSAAIRQVLMADAEATATPASSSLPTSVRSLISTFGQNP